MLSHSPETHFVPVVTDITSRFEFLLITIPARTFLLLWKASFAIRDANRSVTNLREQFERIKYKINDSCQLSNEM